MARRCVEKKVVTRKDGGSQTVCAKYETSADPVVMAMSHDDGQIGALDLEVIRGLDFSAEAVIPPVIGVGVAAATSLMIRKYVTNPTVVKYSHIIGGMASVVASVPIRMWKGDSAMQAAAMAGLLYGAANQVIDMVKGTAWGAGIGVLVPQRQYVGALPAYIPDNSSYMPKQMRSAIDTSAYGTATI